LLFVAVGKPKAWGNQQHKLPAKEEEVFSFAVRSLIILMKLSFLSKDRKIEMPVYHHRNEYT